MPAARIFFQLIADFVVYLGLLIRPRKAIAAENLFLRRQLALYQERKVEPRRIDPATRITLALLSRLFNWRDALIVVQPKTLIRWHRAGFRLLWHWKSKPGRPPIPAELRRLIREMSRDNSLWGEERIANELLVKLGIRVSPRTVRKYMRRKPGRGPRGDQRWRTFLRNHAAAIVACDFCVAVTASFRVLYIFVIIEHASRRLLHCNVTSNPTAAWTLQQLREAIASDHESVHCLVHLSDIKSFASRTKIGKLATAEFAKQVLYMPGIVGPLPPLAVDAYQMAEAYNELHFNFPVATDSIFDFRI